MDKENYLKKLRKLRKILQIFNSILEKTNFKLHWIGELVRIINDSIAAAQLKHKNSFEIFDFNSIDINKNKKLFILGSGGSVNNLKTEDWKEIEQNHSFSFNFFLAHKFTADAHFIESCINNREQSLYYELILQQNKHRRIPYILNLRHHGESILPIPEDISDSFYAQIPVRWPSSNKSIIKLLLKFGSLLYPINDPNFGIHHSSSVCYLLNLGVRLGFKHIVLVGIDMNNTDYFFYKQDDPISKELTKIYKSYYSSDENQKTHRITDPKITNSYHALTTPEYIELYYNAVCKKKGVKLEVTNPSSLLAKFLPIYKFKN
jgi:hypothetical protein